jgi:hypothetical protein
VVRARKDFIRIDVFWYTGLEVTDDEGEYSEYLMDLSKSRVTVLSLLSGFTFTTITILLNQLRDSSSLMAQLTFLFLTAIFNLFLFLLQWQTIIEIGVYHLRNPPPRSLWELTVFNLLMLGTFSLWGISLVLIFLLWNLVYLALVSGVVWTLVFIVTMVVGNRMRKRLGWSIIEE